MSKILAKDLARAGDKYLGRSYSEMDCQAFVERCLADAGLKKDLAGSNAWYRFLKREGWVGTPEDCKKIFGKIPVGAFLFILDANGKEPAKYQGDGIGNASHIGIYTARAGASVVTSATEEGVENASKYNYGNGAIHSSASRDCVCTSTFSGKSIAGGWNRIGLWTDAIDYGMDITNEEKVVIRMTTAIVKTDNGGGVNLRSTASTKAVRLAVLAEGTKVNILSDDGEWAKVSADGLTGYCMSKFLSAEGTDEIQLTLNRTTAEALYAALGRAFGDEGVG